MANKAHSSLLSDWFLTPHNKTNRMPPVSLATGRLELSQEGKIILTRCTGNFSVVFAFAIFSSLFFFFRFRYSLILKYKYIGTLSILKVNMFRSLIMEV